MENTMQQLTLNQLQAISGGTSGSLTTLAQDTFDAFQNGLTPAELGVGLVGMSIGAGLATLGATRTYKVAVFGIVGAYIVHSHYKPDFSGFTTWIGSFFTSATSEATA